MLLIREIRRLKPEYVFNLAPRRGRWQTVRDFIVFRILIGAQKYFSDRHQEGQRKRGLSIPRQQPEWLRLLRIVDSGAEERTFEGTNLNIPLADEERAIEILRSLDIPENAKLIAVGPGSKMQAKRWPAERFIEVGQKLIRAIPEVFFITFGGQDEREYCGHLCDVWAGHAANCAGIASVMQAAAIIRRCKLYLGNDTGTMHLAAAVGVPCVAIFSARDYPGRWEPFGRGHEILRHNTDCAGCMLEECIVNKNRCLHGISSDAVFNATSEVLRVSKH